MNSRLPLATGAAAALAAVACVTATQVGYSAEPSAPIALRGPVPTGAHSVSVRLLPNLEQLEVGEPAAIVPLAAASVEVNGGKYAVAIDPADIPSRFIGDHGVVDFEIDAAMPNGTVQITEASSRITRYGSSSRLFWTDPATTVTESTPAGRAGTRGSVGVLASRTEVEDNGSFVEDQYLSRSGGGSCATEDTGQRRYVSTTIGTAYPLGGVATGSMTVSSSQGADYGIGASADNNVFFLNGSRFTQTGWSFSWPPDARARSFRKEIEYGKYRTGCTALVDGVMYTTNEWKWRPLSETGGVGSNYDIARPNWTRCANVAAGTWTRDNSSGSAYTYGGAVKFRDVIGTDLSIKRQYSSQQKLIYQVSGTNKALCGSNALPASAGKIMMTRR